MREPLFTAADAADAGEILTLQRAAYVAEAQLYGEPFLPPLTETLEEVAAAIAASTVVKAVVDGRIVATGRARVDEASLCLGRFAVAPDRQGQGFGTRLISALEATATRDVRRFELFTGFKSERNLRLYERCGYSEFRRVPGVTGVELIYLEKLV
ncbi:GNAT family N-acetyltransferase [Glycomyces endophyticus]|uniref:GNAT family N-acetyltransferase n=1 Tax=Glycomyces endophyticus TaxID=480996 RepID=A0ABP4SMZ9_9ACTN